MTTYPAPMCLGCKHYRRTGSQVCDAFPSGIPLAIWHSVVDHRQVVDGDHGVRFEPESAADEAYVVMRFPSAHEHRFAAERCMVCGCGEPLNSHGKPYITAGTAGNIPGDAPTYPVTIPPVDDCYVALFLPGFVGQPLADLVGWENSDPKDLHIQL